METVQDLTSFTVSGTLSELPVNYYQQQIVKHIQISVRDFGHPSEEICVQMTDDSTSGLCHLFYCLLWMVIFTLLP